VLGTHTVRENFRTCSQQSFRSLSLSTLLGSSQVSGQASPCSVASHMDSKAVFGSRTASSLPQASDNGKLQIFHSLPYTHARHFARLTAPLSHVFTTAKLPLFVVMGGAQDPVLIATACTVRADNKDIKCTSLTVIGRTCLRPFN
jgi:hypothetical protein